MPPVGQFIDYSPGPQPGSFGFRRADGSTLLAAGPDAQALAQAIERSKAIGPQPVAQNGGFGGQVNNDWATDAPAPNPAVQEAAPPPPAIARPEAPPAQPQGRAALQPIARTATGVIVRDPVTGQMAEHTYGSPGVSKAQLQKRAADSVAVPVSQSQAVQGGFERNADYEEQLANANIDQKLATQTRADVEQANAQREADFYSQQVATQQALARREQQTLQETQALHQRDLQRLQAAQEDVRAFKVDPTRSFSGVGGTLKLIGATIAAGLGALGAGLARTPNVSLEIINRGLDRDVAAQESELAAKKESANNLLRQWTESGASLEQAKAAVKAQQLEYVKSQVGQIAAVNKSAAVQANAQALTAELDKSLAEQLERYRIESLGKRTAEVTSRMATPQAGSAGGIRPLTLAQESEIANIRKTEGEAGRGPARGEGAQKVAGQIEALDAIGNRLSTKKSDDAAFSPENQNIVTRGARGLVNTVAGERTWLPGSKEDRDNAQEFDQIRNDLMAQTSVANGQGAMSDPEAKRAMTAIGEARTWGELQRAHQYLREKTAGMAKGYGIDSPAPARPEELGMKKRGTGG